MVTRSSSANKSTLLLSRPAPIDDPAVTDLVLETIGNLPDDPVSFSVRLSALRSMIGTLRDDSRARAALEKIAAENPDRLVKQSIATMLEKR